MDDPTLQSEIDTLLCAVIQIRLQLAVQGSMIEEIWRALFPEVEPDYRSQGDAQN